MAVAYSPRIISDGLRVALDVRNAKCWSGSGNTLNNIGGSGVPTGTTLVTATDGVAGEVIDFNGMTRYNIPLSPAINHDTWSLMFLSRSTGTPSSNYRAIIRLLNTGSTWGYCWLTDTRETTAPYILSYSRYDAGTWLTRASVSNVDWVSGDWVWQGLTFNSNAVRHFINGKFTVATTMTDNASWTDIDEIDINNSAGNQVQLGPTYLYDKVLTDAEMEQNFDAVRGRFGL